MFIGKSIRCVFFMDYVINEYLIQYLNSHPCNEIVDLILKVFDFLNIAGCY